MALSLDEKLKREKERLEKIQKKIEAIENTKSKEVRKLETRAKVILGAHLLKRAKEDERYLRTLKTIKSEIEANPKSRKTDLKAIQLLIEAQGISLND